MSTIVPRIFCPYPGLRPFTEEESLYFQGREKHIVKIKDELQKRRFLMVTGASGDGKSSLIFAGLIPTIKAGFFKAKFGTWKISVFRPGNDPLTNFSRSLAPHFGKDKETSIRSNLSLGYSSLTDLYKNSSLFEGDILGEEKAVKGAANLLIVVDQFEEFFTNKENFNRETAMPSTEANTAVNLLIETTRIAREEDLAIYIVCTMRSDYIGNAPSFRGLPELIGKNQFFVPRLNRAEMLSAVTEPAVLAGAKISQRLAQRMLNDLSSVNTDVLPVLQHAVRRVWHIAAAGNVELDLWHYCAVGGMESKDLPDEQRESFEKWFEGQPEAKKLFYKGQKKSYRQDLSNVLNLHGNILFESASEYYNEHGDGDISKGEAQTILRLIFQCLTKIDDSRAVRNRITLATVTDIIDRDQYDSEKIGRLIDIYRDPENTLVYPFIEDGEDRKELNPDTLIDITHEALIRNWKRLSKWTKEEYDSANVFRELNAQLDRWVREGKSNTYLLTAGPYEYYHKWYEQQNPSADWLNQYSDTELYKTDGITLSPLVEKDEDVDDLEAKTTTIQLSADLAEFLVDSKTNIEKVQKVRRIIVAAISVLLVISVGALIWAVTKKNEATALHTQIATTAEANRLATIAYTQIEQDPTLAFRLAEASYQIEPTPLNKQVIMAAYAKVPFYQKLEGHRGGINSMSISDDRQFIVTSAMDYDARLWNFEGELLAVLKGHKNMSPFSPYASSISHDSKLIATCSKDSTARLWDFKGVCVAVLKHNGSVNSVVFSSDDQYVLTTSDDKSTRVWSVLDLIGSKSTSVPSVKIMHDERVNLAVFSRDRTSILTASDNILSIWNRSGTLVNLISQHKLLINDISLSNSGSLFATSSNDSTLIVWNNSGTIISQYKSPDEKMYFSVFSPDHSKVAMVTFGNDVILLDIASGEIIKLRGHTAPPWSVNFSPDGNSLVTASDDGTIRVWDLMGNELMLLKGHTSQVIAAYFSTDGSQVVTAGGDGTARIWTIKPMELPVFKGHTGYVFDARFSADGSEIISSGADYSSKLWTIGGDLKNDFTKHGHYFVEVADFLPNQELLLSVSYDGYLRVRDREGQVIQKFQNHSGFGSKILYSNEGKYVSHWSNDQEAQLYTIGDSLELIYKFGNTIDIHFQDPGGFVFTCSTDSNLNIWEQARIDDSVYYKSVSTIALSGSFFETVVSSDDGKYIITACEDSTIQLWLVKSFITSNNPKPVFIKKIPAIINSLKFAPNSNLVASSSSDHLIRLWGINGDSIAAMVGHSDVINDFNFSSDGKFVVSASGDRSVRLWDLDGREIMNYPGHSNMVMRARFSPDDNYILSASLDHTLRLIPIRVEDVLDKINTDKVRGEVWQLSEADRRVYGIID